MYAKGLIHLWSIPTELQNPGPSWWFGTCWTGRFSTRKFLQSHRWNPQNLLWWNLQTELHNIHSLWMREQWHSEGQCAERVYQTQQKGMLYDSLSIGLLQQGAPELWACGWMNKQQFSISRGQSIIHHHIHPFPKLPQLHPSKQMYLT